MANEGDAMNTAGSGFRYLPSRPRDAQWGLHVSGAGWATVPAGSAYPPPGHPELYDFSFERGRRLPEYQVVYIAAGSGIFEAEGRDEARVTAGSVILVFPGVWHRYRPDDHTGWREYWVSFTGDWMDRIVQHKFFSATAPLLEVGPAEPFQATFDQLLERLWSAPPGFPHLIAADVVELLAIIVAGTDEETQHLIMQGPRDVESLTDPLVAEALRLIWSGSHLRLTVAALGKELRTTSRSLERRFKQALGRTVKEEILRCRLDRVRRLLVDTDLSISEIVTASGFASADALTRAVRKADGVTPLRLRRQLRQERQRQRDSTA
jgi:AraC-like DNA-binding protein